MALRCEFDRETVLDAAIAPLARTSCVKLIVAPVSQHHYFRRHPQAIARNPLAFTRLSSLRDGPSGRFSPRSHLLTASFRTLR